MCPDDMASKKKERELTYLQMPLPQGQKMSRMTKVEWGQLNMRQTMDTGVLSKEMNISTTEYPYLTPSQRHISIKGGYSAPISMFGFDDFLLVVYRSGTAIKIDYITDTKTYTGTLQSSISTELNETVQRCIVKFNVYSDPTDPDGGTFTEKLLIYPDKKSMDFKVTGNFTPKDLDSGINQTPDLKYAVVHLSRIFGVNDERVYASAFNDYTNWDLDVGEYNESSAWCSPAQSNTKANGKFTGITAFQNHVICFKKDFMHEIYNNKNPFRIQDIYAEGAIDNRSIQDVDGKLFFVSDDHVKIYTGGNPTVMSYPLDIGEYKKAVSGTDGRKYYLYCETEKNAKRLLVYDTLVNSWAEESVESEVKAFARNINGMYMLCTDGNVYQLDRGSYGHAWSFETDLVTGQSIDIKHLNKLQLLADLDRNSWIKVYALYNGEEYSSSMTPVFDSKGRTGRLPIRVLTRKTANYSFKLHFEGYGYVKLYQMELILSQGGNLYV